MFTALQRLRSAFARPALPPATSPSFAAAARHPALLVAGVSLWLDNITRTLLDDGTLQHYIDGLHVTGLTSNPTIFDKAITSGAYDAAIRTKVQAGQSDEALFFDLALEDLRRAADHEERHVRADLRRKTEDIVPAQLQ